MKILCLSDLHGNLIDIPNKYDLILCAGDICPNFSRNRLLDSERQAWWINKKLIPWINSLKTPFVWTAGNHDFIFERSTFRHDINFNELEQDYFLLDNWNEVNNLKIYGTPWQPYFGGWAFNAEEFELYEYWELIPDDTDILIVHGPPYYCGDHTLEGNRTGSPSLRKRILEIKPRLVVTGHIHESTGIHDLEGIKVVNASILDRLYNLINNGYEIIL